MYFGHILVIKLFCINRYYIINCIFSNNYALILYLNAYSKINFERLLLELQRNYYLFLCSDE